MSYYGPWIGEYLNDLAKRMVEHTIPSQETQ